MKNRDINECESIWIVGTEQKLKICPNEYIVNSQWKFQTITLTKT